MRLGYTLKRIASASLLLAPSLALACLGPSHETWVLLPQPPETAQERAVVAEVEIRSVRREEGEEGRHWRISKAVVVDVIQGIGRGRTLTVREAMDSCRRPHDLAVGQRHFVAGRVTGERLVEGDWSGDEIPLSPR